MKLKRLSIGTFNLYNLNEPGLSMYTDKTGWSQEEYDRKIEWTSRTIRLLHPDIFGFQELWHSASIERALTQSGIVGDYDLIVPENADGKRIVCAAIVRKGLMISEPQWLKRFPEKFTLKSSGDDPQTPAITVSIPSFSRPVLHFSVRPREDHEPIHVCLPFQIERTNQGLSGRLVRGRWGALQKARDQHRCGDLDDPTNGRGRGVTVHSDRADERDPHSGHSTWRHQ